MARNITIRELTASECQRVQSAPRFDRVHPTRCTGCGATGPFFRRVFEITGVPAGKRCDDDTQALLGHHFRAKHRLAWVVFKTEGRGFYADAAECANCSSTAVTYDITLDDELYAEIARRTGKPVEQLRQELEQARAALERLDD